MAYYAPQAVFGLTARFQRPKAEMAVQTNVLLSLGEQGQRVHGGFLLAPANEKLFAVDFSVPAGWHVTSVAGPDNKPLIPERYGAAGEAGRVHVRLPQGVPPEQEYRLYFEALSTPAGWLSGWESAKAVFPVFAVVGATRDTGAIAIEAQDDMIVRPETLERLTPLDEDGKKRYALGGVAASLAYRYEGRNDETPYRAALSVVRTRPRLTARSFSFFRVEQDALTARYEITYTIEEAKTRQLSFSLPRETPAQLAITALDGVKLKEFSSRVDGNRRRWDVLLGEPRRGSVRLAVNFQQPLGSKSGSPGFTRSDKEKPSEGGTPTGLGTVPILAAETTSTRKESFAAAKMGLSPSASSTGGETSQSPAILVAPMVRGGRGLSIGAGGRGGERGARRASEHRRAPHRRGRVGRGRLPAGTPLVGCVRLRRRAGRGAYDRYAASRLRPATGHRSAGGAEDQRLGQRSEPDHCDVQTPHQGAVPGGGLAAGLGVLVGLCRRPADQAADRRRPDPLEFAGVADGRALHATDNLPDARRRLRTDRQPRPAGADARARADEKGEGVEVPIAELKWNLTLPNGYEVTRTLGTVLSPIEPPEPAALCVLKIAGAMLFCPAGIGKVMRASSEEAQFLEGPLDGVKSEMRAGMVKSGPKSKPPVAFAPSRKLPRRRPRENR